MHPHTALAQCIKVGITGSRILVINIAGEAAVLKSKLTQTIPTTDNGVTITAMACLVPGIYLLLPV
jgi:hypothetical protein